MAIVTASFGASAQTVGIGSTRTGAQAAISAAIAKVTSTHSGIQMRTQAYAGAQQSVPVVNAGKLEFGTANIVQLTLSVKGGNDLSKQPHPNLRLAATLMPFRNSLLVKDTSAIKNISDMKGRRFNSGFNPQPLARLIMEAYLANGGLKWSDVQAIPASGFQDSWNQMKVGKVDGVTIALGTAMGKELEAALGKMRYINIDESPARMKAMQTVLPGAYVATAQPDKAIPGLAVPTKVMVYDYTLWAGKHVADDVVYKVVKALYEHADELKSASPHWRLFDRKTMGKDLGLAYHPGAAKYWKEVGIYHKK